MTLNVYAKGVPSVIIKSIMLNVVVLNVMATSDIYREITLKLFGPSFQL
jgi:hypothetical protein